jgi:hypothetical protein
MTNEEGGEIARQGTLSRENQKRSRKARRRKARAKEALLTKATNPERKQNRKARRTSDTCETRTQMLSGKTAGLRPRTADRGFRGEIHIVETDRRYIKEEHEEVG